jgi:hypothetical protein
MGRKSKTERKKVSERERQRETKAREEKKEREREGLSRDECLSFFLIFCGGDVFFGQAASPSSLSAHEPWTD